jgi:hypothetical protein
MVVAMLGTIMLIFITLSIVVPGSWPYPQILNQAEKACQEQMLQLIGPLQHFIDSLDNSDTWARCYKTLYVRNVRIFIIGESVCPRHAFQATSNACGQDQEPILKWSTF